MVLYATKEGHTADIAEYLREAMWKRGLPSEKIAAAELPAGFKLADYSGAILAASVHVQRHESEMADFVKLHRAALEGMPTVFLSVSLSEAGAEDIQADPAKRKKAAEDADGMIADFLKETGWHPGRIEAVAGALVYSKYNFFLRLVMKRIARLAGGDTDTSKDFDYTDYAALDHLVDELIAEEGVPSRP